MLPLDRPRSPEPALDETLLLDAHDRDHRPGRVVAGRYRLERRLASGGMGSVWAATHLLLEQPVAVKLLRGAARSPAGVERLLREAKLAASLRHPAIVQVYDIGLTEEGEPFLVMELLEGGDAAELVARTGPLGGEQAARLLVPVLSGLALAHRRGIVHRDLKPENIFLAHVDGARLQPKLVDFGVARAVSVPAPSKLTTAGMLVGTPEFMAPEQVECLDDVDARADLWAVGVTLYFLITGRAPFSGPDGASLFDAILDAHVPYPKGAADLDGDLWTILTECLRRDRAARWQRAEDVEAALTRWLTARGVHEDLAGRSLRARSPDERTRPTAPEVRAPARAGSRPTLDQAIFATLKKKLT
jgi:serine/threonine-protein kinase